MNLHEILDGEEYGLFIGENLRKGVFPKEPIIEHLLYEKDVICISSKAGVGKSILAQQLMCCLTTGNPFLETFRVTRPCYVLYIQTEGDRTETIERLDLMGRYIQIEDSRWAHLNMPGASFNVENEVDQLIAMIKSKMTFLDVIIIDPLYTTIKGNLNDNQVVTDWIRNIRKLKGVFNCAIIVLNHENKEVYSEGIAVDKGANSIFGSTFWAAFFNHNYRLKVFDGHHILEIGKNRSGKAIDAIPMKMVNTDTIMYVPYDADLTDNGLRIAEFVMRIKVATAKKIIEITGVKRATAFRILKRMVDDKKLSRVYDPNLGEMYTCLGDKEALEIIRKMEEERKKDATKLHGKSGLTHHGESQHAGPVPSNHPA